MDLSSCIDLTGPKSIARTTLAGMSETHKGEVDQEINKSLKKKINKEVKGVIVDIAHRELLDNLLMKHLTMSWWRRVPHLVRSLCKLQNALA